MQTMNPELANLYNAARAGVMLVHFYSLGRGYSRCIYAHPPRGWEGCEPCAVGGYGEDGDYFTGVVWFNADTGRFSTIQPHA